MSIVCNVLVYLFEQLISLMYYNVNFELKRKKSLLFFCFLVSFIIQYTVHNINSNFSFLLNIVSFFICNFFVLRTCYKTKLFQSLFNVILLEGLMITTELIVVYSVSFFFHVNISEYKDNITILFIDSAAAKVVYFFVVMLITRIRTKNIDKSSANDFAMALLILPLLSSLIIILFGKILTDIDVKENTYLLFTIITIMLLVANVIVFLVHEKVVSTLNQNTEFQLEKQKARISEEYYQELEHQYDKSNILIHDIKKHLNVITHISEDEHYDKVKEYVTSINDGYDIQNIKRYTTNKLLNVITNRYANICDEYGVNLFVDIRNVELSFISDSDLTAIIDNLLENACEAARKSNEKSITFGIDKKNENYILISIFNSCDNPPKIINGNITSSKFDKGVHGYGLRSVKRAVKKYNGDINFQYKEQEKIFGVTIIFNKN